MKARSWIALVLGIIASLGISYGAYTLATYSWNQVVDYRGPYAKAALPAGAVPGTGTADADSRVVFVIVDGLREDVSRSMPVLNTLRAHGYDGLAVTGQPSLSFPNWTTLMSGASQRFSGVTTNWFEERVPVETLVDTALAADRVVAVSAPTDFEMLYGVKRSPYVYLRDWEKGVYMTGGIVDNAIRLASESGATLLIVHSPDIDEAGHASGGASKEYLDTARKVDADLGRLVSALQDRRTTFVIASDHGHIDTGGHGGPETIVTEVPVVLAGPSVALGSGAVSQEQIAPTVARIAGLPAPRNAAAPPIETLVNAPSDDGRFAAQQRSAFAAYAAAVTGGPLDPASGDRRAFDAATQARLQRERGERLPMALGLVLAAILLIAVVGIFSWRALVSALAGAAGYYITYNALYFGLHRYGLWSLSSFNSEDLLKAFMNARMIEAVIAGVVAAFIAADVYLVTRKEPKRPKGEYLPGWLALGVATALVIQATLVIQVAWYLWFWGASLVWFIPDLQMGFKYDLDLIQLTAVGAIALLGPVITYLAGRYHPIRPPKAAPSDTTVPVASS
ncbi:MAG: alkaline phosphatase family protein [Coriobacteriia bacterium]|nr:alkaline phosphatase family protein [Coriobacteriia bacterium]